MPIAGTQKAAHHSGRFKPFRNKVWEEDREQLTAERHENTDIRFDLVVAYVLCHSLLAIKLTVCMLCQA